MAPVRFVEFDAVRRNVGLPDELVQGNPLPLVLDVAG
jgi:hypothetical protein